MTRFLTRRWLAALAGLGSAGLLVTALGYQYLGELMPCSLCIWQRWPHLAAAVLALLVVAVWPARILALLGALAAATTSGIGIYHVGVQRGWWPGPDACSAADPAGLSTGDLLDRILATPIVRCDEVVWEFLSISMAGWNALISAGLVLLWLAAAAAPRTARRA